MELIRLKNIKKDFIKDKNVTHVLKGITLSFPSKGFVSILGKSGCGKSTLLNILSLIDNLSSGLYEYKNKDISKISIKEKERFLNQEVGILFQKYQLIEDQNVIYNVALPLLIRGYSKKEADEEAIKYLSLTSIDVNAYKRKVNLLSGGEKQRVALVRALITKPSFIVADEPTGALDEENSKLVMDMLKKISNNRLVIMVSHNVNLVKEYSDRIIQMKDGKIESDNLINSIDDSYQNNEKKTKKKESWISPLIVSNLNKRKRTHLLSLLAMSFSLSASLLVMGFINNSFNSINNDKYKHLDYGVSTLTNEKVVSKEGDISLVQESRPSTSEQNTFLTQTNNNFICDVNFDILLSQLPKIDISDFTLDNFYFKPIYSFEKDYIDKSLLLNGSVPKIDSLSNVLLNKSGYEYLKNKLGKNPIGEIIKISSDYQYGFISSNDKSSYLIDTFSFSQNARIVGVVDESIFLANKAFYYSYISFKDLLLNTKMDNLSNEYGFDYTWYDLLKNCSDNDEISSYSCRVFLKDIANKNLVERYINENENNIKLSNNSITIFNSINGFIDATTIGLEIFLFIAIIGTILIIGLISYSSFSSDCKLIAILKSLGAKNADIYETYCSESLVISLVSILITFLLSTPLIKLVNKIIANYVGLEDMLLFPKSVFGLFNGSSYLIVFLVTILLSIISSYLPIKLSKRNSIAKELNNND